MKHRSRAALFGFAASAALLVAGLGALTAVALRLERAEQEALERSALEEDVRLALWRMDAAVAAFLAQENSRPADRFLSSGATEVDEEPLFLRRRFEVEADGRVRPESGAETPEWLARWVGQSERWQGPPGSPPPAVAEPVPAPRPAAAVPAPVPAPAAAERPERVEEILGVVVREAPERGVAERQDPFTQQQLNTLEFEQRSVLASQAAAVPRAALDEPVVADDPPAEPPAPEEPRAAPLRESAVRSRARVEDGIRQPLSVEWVGDQLILRRRVIAAGRPREQITWLDWTSLGDFLLAQAREVLPQASVLPADEAALADPGRLLALLPVRLEPGAVERAPPAPLSLRTPTGSALAVAWAAAALALAGIGALLWGSVRLSRRREDFVSAVTHELRTPLTTFRLNSEMLAEGMVPDGERQGYAETLRSQADRLGHLVDNVLSFSRLEKGKWRAPPPVALAEILDPVLPLLAERAREAGLELAVDLPPEVLAARVRADRERLERILFNLVDNACKYAVDAEPAKIEIAGERRGRRLVLRVRDHGPGVPRRQRRRLFRPFHKSAEHAAGGAPGVGLGLSLARRLARGLGGDLVLSPAASGSGAVFELVLRRDG